MSKRFSRWEKRLLLFQLALFLCLGHFVAVDAHYAPPYHFNPALVEQIAVYQGESGYQYGKVISDREGIEEIVELLNDFKYIDRKEFPPMVGCGDCLCMIIGIRKVWISFSDDRISVGKRDDNGSVAYYGPPGYFSLLEELAHEKGEFLG